MLQKTLIAACAVLALAIPVFALQNVTSGLQPGDYVTPFHPKHVAGPDAGTETCPPCKYQERPQIQVWVNGDDEANVLALIRQLSEIVKENEAEEMKAFVIVVSHCEMCVEKAERLGEEAGVDNVAVAFIGADHQAIEDYKINLEAKNTVMFYRDF